MPGRVSSTPSPAELSAWLRVASPRTARGRYRWSAARQRWTETITAVGGRPVMVSVPADVEVAFWHAAPHAWRVEGPDGPLATSDGATAVVWDGRGRQVGASLLMSVGPDGLLHGREPRGRRASQGLEPDLSGSVQAAELLGRPCWRWESAERTMWVDEQTGCVLRLDEERGSRVLTALEVDVALDPALFAPPIGAVVAQPEPRSRAGAALTGERLPTAERPRAAPFTVPWWPDGAPGEAVDGDAAVPELLVQLDASGEGDARFWLGVAPAGTPARVRGGSRVRRWEGDGWSFALSWRGEVSADDVERIVASTPGSWT